MFDFLKNFKESNKLCFVRQFSEFDYSKAHEKIESNLEEIFELFKNDSQDTVYIKSKFNGKYYQFHDLDNNHLLDVFKLTHKNSPYVIFSSSAEHHWAILDISKPLDAIYKNSDWISVNDSCYVSCQKKSNDLVMRGIYENESRRPKIVEKHLENLWTNNFKCFIDKLDHYFKNDGLELSVLRYKDPALSIKLNRNKKLKKLKTLNHD